MRLFRTLKRLAVIVWKDGGLSWLWAAGSAVPGLIQSAKKYFPDETQMAAIMLDAVQWWWGLPILTAWVIFSLSRRILAYETPALEIDAIKDGRDSSWWLEVRNSGTKGVKDCAVDFQLETATGKRVFPHSFGWAREGGGSNPFPLRADQRKQGRFADLDEGKITIYGTTIDRRPTRISLEENKYIVTVGVYSELEGGQCKRTFTVLRDGSGLHVS
jgi:hypothetical protein